MRALKKVVPALLLVCLLGAVMPVAASSDNPTSYQSEIDWRFVSPKPRPGANDIVAPRALPVLPDSVRAPLFWVILSWVLGLAN